MSSGCDQKRGPVDPTTILASKTEYSVIPLIKLTTTIPIIAVDTLNAGLTSNALLQSGARHQCLDPFCCVD